jgi:hypothetical protein
MRWMPPRHRARASLVATATLATLAFLAPVGPARAGHPAGSTTPARDEAARTASRLEAETLTRDVALLGLEARHGRPSSRAGTLARLNTAAERRRALLARLLDEEDAAAVLRVALPAPLRASLPPAVQAHVETEVDLDGDLEVLHQDDAAGGRYHHFLRLATRRLRLHFAGEPPRHPTGTRVKARGVLVGEALALEPAALEPGGAGTPVLAAALPGTLGAQRTLVILVNFPDDPSQPYTPEQARQVVFDTTSGFDLENSYGQTWLTGEVRGWYPIALSRGTCDYWTLASQARQAAQAAGADLSAYARFVYAFPRNACSWWGLGTVGGTPSQAWVNGSFALQVVGHELGHGFGLYHSHALECGAATLGGSCSSIEYGDTVDIMGSSAGHFTAFQKERLGWLGAGAAPPLVTAEAAGTYTIERYESPGTGPKALKVLKATDPATGRRTYYYIEYREAYGFDAFLSGYPHVTSGLVLHTGSEASPDSSFLLDLTPSTSSWQDPALPFGQSFHDPAAGVTITAVSETGTTAQVRVAFDGAACVRRAPEVALAPVRSQWVAPGTPVAFAVTATSRDGAGCGPADVLLDATPPGAGWTTTFAQGSLTLDPGQSAGTTLTVASPVPVADGFHRIEAGARVAAEPALRGTTSATYVVVSALAVGLAADQPGYRRTQTATFTASVRLGDGSPVEGVPVAFRLTRPNGTRVKAIVTTGTDGLAVWRYKVKSTDKVGTWTARAIATGSGGLTGEATTTFTVSK